MKDCCKTGSDKAQKKSGLKKWFNYVIYAVIAIILIGALLLQLTGN